MYVIKRKDLTLVNYETSLINSLESCAKEVTDEEKD
jgi:hypothetical protein